MSRLCWDTGGEVGRGEERKWEERKEVLDILFFEAKGKYVSKNGKWHPILYTVFRKKTPTHIFFHIYMSDV